MKTIQPKQYGEGRVMERVEAQVPGFVKLAYLAIATGALAYFFVLVYGEMDHPERAPLVRALNAATEASATLMYAIVAMIVIFGVIVVALSFGKACD